MAYTRSWSELIAVVSKLAKGVGGLTDISADICDYISNDMYIEYPWKDTITTIATQTIPLLDGVQDYSSPINIYRLTRAVIARYDTHSTQYQELDVVDDNAIDMVPRSCFGIRSVSQQQATGTLRLEGAVQIGTGNRYELIGEYQMNPVKVVALSQGLWFKDQYVQVAVEGLLYWTYKLSDDSRAGSVITNVSGESSYSGQLAIYKSSLSRMKFAEDWGASQNLFPADPIGAGSGMNLVFGPW